MRLHFFGHSTVLDIYGLIKFSKYSLNLQRVKFKWSGDLHKLSLISSAIRRRRSEIYQISPLSNVGLLLTSVSSWPFLLFFYVLLYCVMYHFHIELSAFYFFNENFTRSLNYKYCEYILK